VNGALAAMNGIPAEAHIGKRLRQIVGNVAAKVEPLFEHVLSTGRPICNFELTAHLPTRTEAGNWIQNYYPIRDSSGKVKEVAAIVLEITKRKRLQECIARLTEKSLLVADTLRKEKLPSAGGSTVQAKLLAGLLATCICETERISDLLQPPLLLSAAEQGQALFHPILAASDSSTGLSLVGEPSRDAQPKTGRLTERERQVLALVASGKTNKEVAAVCNISARTVETHRARLMLKLDLHSTSELARYAVRAKLVDV
jgi:DNA-binding CsgD family transcriptional regulator